MLCYSRMLNFCSKRISFSVFKSAYVAYPSRLITCNRTTIRLQHQHLPSQTVQTLVDKITEKNEKYASTPQLGQILTHIQQAQLQLKELEALKNDKDLREIAIADSEKLKQSLSELGAQLLEVMIIADSDPMDNSDGLMVEVSAGVGGQEAMLFAQVLFEMYRGLSVHNGWEFEDVSFSETELGGIRFASASITGHNVYRSLKFESGVHRVQRIPKTEKAGRVHTSTSSVAILPIPSEILVVINPADLRIETKRASGAGGQHVNKTESAVRLTHLPSGIIIDSQTQRSQFQNRATAMNMLRAKLYEKLVNDQRTQIRTTRKLQTGSSSRNEKIRTYNYPQDRVTDHRIGLTLHNIQSVVEGRGLGTLLENLEEYDRNERINSILGTK